MFYRNLAVALTAALVALVACAETAPRPPKPIPDIEPAVTEEVGALLAQVAADALSPARLTDNANGAVTPALRTQMASLLRACPMPVALELLERRTKGEDRQYLYRAACGATPLLVAIDFNKGAKVNKLSVTPE